MSVTHLSTLLKMHAENDGMEILPCYVLTLKGNFNKFKNQSQGVLKNLLKSV